MTKRKTGQWMIGGAIAMVPLGLLLFLQESNRMEAEGSVRAFGGTTSGVGHLPSLLIWGLGAIVLICGVIVLSNAGSSDGDR